jgi:hypothetical protein
VRRLPPDVGVARGIARTAFGMVAGRRPSARAAHRRGLLTRLLRAAAARSSVLVAHVPAASLGFGRAGPDAQGESEAPAAAVVAAA